MSTINDAKIILIPSGYKSQKVYSVKPTNGDGDFTFSRTSEATRLNAGGNVETLSANLPRLNYIGSSCPTLLLEEDRTNIQAYSEVFDGAAWSVAFGSVSANQTISPKGDLTAYSLTTTSSSGLLGGSVSITANTTYSYSIFVKPNTTNICKVQMYDSNTGGQINPFAFITFDMSSETITSSLGDASFDKLVGGWYRLKVSGTSPNPLGGGGTGVQILLTEVGSIFIWGAQMEQGSAASSYIKTITTSVSRTKDQCLNAGNSTLFDFPEGSFFVDVKPYKNTSFYNISLSDGSANNRVSFQFQNNNTQVKIRIVAGGSEISQVNESVNFGSRNKLCITFKNNEFKTYINGSLVETITSGNAPTSIDRLNFAVYNGTNNYFQGEVYEVRIYDKILTQTQATQLTTL